MLYKGSETEGVRALGKCQDSCHCVGDLIPRDNLYITLIFRSCNFSFSMIHYLNA